MPRIRAISPDPELVGAVQKERRKRDKQAIEEIAKDASDVVEEAEKLKASQRRRETVVELARQAISDKDEPPEDPLPPMGRELIAPVTFDPETSPEPKLTKEDYARGFGQLIEKAGMTVDTIGWMIVVDRVLPQEVNGQPLPSESVISLQPPMARQDLNVIIAQKLGGGTYYLKLVRDDKLVVARERFELAGDPRLPDQPGKPKPDAVAANGEDTPLGLQVEIQKLLRQQMTHAQTLALMKQLRNMGQDEATDSPMSKALAALDARLGAMLERFERATVAPKPQSDQAMMAMSEQTKQIVQVMERAIEKAGAQQQPGKALDPMALFREVMTVTGGLVEMMQKTRGNDPASLDNILQERLRFALDLIERGRDQASGAAAPEPGQGWMEVIKSFAPVLAPVLLRALTAPKEVAAPGAPEPSEIVEQVHQSVQRAVRRRGIGQPRTVVATPAPAGAPATSPQVAPEIAAVVLRAFNQLCADLTALPEPAPWVEVMRELPPPMWDVFSRLQPKQLVQVFEGIVEPSRIKDFMAAYRASQPAAWPWIQRCMSGAAAPGAEPPEPSAEPPAPEPPHAP